MIDKNTETKILKSLTNEGFKITRYSEYEHAVNIIGDLHPKGMFKIPIKMAVEIVKNSIDLESLTSFIKYANSTLSKKISMMATQEFDKLDTNIQELIINNQIEYLGGKTLQGFIEAFSIEPEEIKHYEKTTDILGHRRLADALPELALQKIPSDIADIMKGIKQDWEIFEDAVFGCFSNCLSIDTIQLGYKSRFQRKPEGIILPAIDPFAILYECKSASESYTMSVDDERAVTEYINDNKEKIKALYRAELRYFIIIGPNFEGDLAYRRSQVLGETGVTLFFIEAEALKKLSLWANQMQPSIKAIIDLRKILNAGEVVVNSNTIQSYIEEFDEENKTRY